MLLSVILAQIFGIYFILMAILMVTQPERFRQLVSDLSADSSAMFLASITTCLLGITLVVLHTFWGWNWQVVITLIAWMTLIKAIIWLICPHWMLSVSQRLYAGRSFYVMVGVIALLGVFLLYHGFSMMAQGDVVVVKID